MAADSRRRALDLLQPEEAGPSLMELMLRDAEHARREVPPSSGSGAGSSKVAHTTASGAAVAAAPLAGASTSTLSKTTAKPTASTGGFGSGFKRGFLTSSAPASRASTSAKPLARQEKPTEVHARKVDTAQSLRLAEVQAAMAGSAVSAASGLLANTQEWMTPELLQRLATNPKLVKAFTDPRFARMVEAMQRDPQGVMAQAELGDITESKTATASAAPAPPPQQSSSSSTAMTATSVAPPASLPLPPDTDPDVARVLADAELRTLIMDPAMREVLQRCGDPWELQRVMRDPILAPKIRKLVDAGLVKFA